MSEASPAQEPLRAYVSYSHREMAAADRVVAALEVAHFLVSIDRRDSPYGEEWRHQHVDLIRAADTVIWLLSPTSTRSRRCNWEIGEARRLNKRVIAVMVETVPPDSLPEWLGPLQIIPSEGIFDGRRHLSALTAAMNADGAWLKRHTALARQAHDWQAKGRPAALRLRGLALKEAQAWIDRRPLSAPPPSDEIFELLLASRRAQGTRLRLAIAAFVAVALVGVGLAGAGLWQRQMAIAEREAAEDQEARAVEAERNAERRAASEAAAKEAALRDFQIAKETVDGLIVDVAEGLRGVEDRSDAERVRRIFQRLAQSMDRLLATAPDDPALLLSRAAMLVNFGETYLAVGAGADALVSFQRALAIHRELATRDPANLEYQRSVSVSLERIGDARMQIGEPAAALSAYEECLSIRRELVARDPGNVEWESAVSIVLTRIGDAKLGAGDAAGALVAYDESLAIFRELAEDDPGNIEWLRGVLVSLTHVGDASFRAGRAREALAAYEESLAIARQLAEQDPENVEWLRGVSASLDHISDVKLFTGDAVGALAAHEESLALFRRLAEQEPENIAWLRDVSVGLNRIGDVRLRIGDPAWALAAYEESLAIARRLAEQEKENLTWQRDLVVTLNNIGDVKARAGDEEGALAAYEESLEIVRRLAEQDVENSVLRSDMIVGLYRIANMTDGERRADAIAEAFLILDDLKQRNALTAEQAAWADILTRLRDEGDP